MTTQLLKKPTKLVREFASLDALLREKILEAARHAINVRDGLSRPATRSDNGGKVYLRKYFDCCIGIRRPTTDWPYSHLSHARTVTHIAHQFGLEEYERAIRTAVRLLDAGQPLDEVVGKCHALSARESIKILIQMAHST
jgi:hypothetical protein